MEFSIIGGGALMSNSIILIINTRLLFETTKNNIFQNFPNLGGSCQTSYGKFHNFYLMKASLRLNFTRLVNILKIR